MKDRIPIIVFDTEKNSILEYESVAAFHKSIDYTRFNFTDNFIADRYIVFKKEIIEKNNVLQAGFFSLPPRYKTKICQNIIANKQKEIFSYIYEKYKERYIKVYKDGKLIGEFKSYTDVANFLNIPIGTVRSRLNRSKNQNISNKKGIVLTYQTFE